MPPLARRALASAWAALGLGALGITAARPAPTAATAAVAMLPTMSAPDRADSLLIVAPHPDDESLCCAGIIQRALEAGARVTVVWVTSGDAFELDAVIVERTLRPKGANLRRLARLRMGEADCAATRLRIPEDRRLFLGYPDGGLRRLLDEDYARPYRSPYTGAVAVPYPGTVTPGAGYEGRNLERDLAGVIDAAAPSIVLAPDSRDRHPDHAAVGEFVRRALARRGGATRLYTWVVHAGPRWPRPRGFHPELGLRPPRGLRTLDWQRFPLTVEERARKRLAIECHRTQMTVMPSLLLAFDRADEIFARSADSASASLPPAPDSDPADPRLDEHGAHQFVQAVGIGSD